MDALSIPPEWAGSAESYAQHVASGAARGFASHEPLRHTDRTPVVIGVDPATPDADATVVVRRGELGEIERMRVITGPERRAFVAAQDPSKQRTAKEMARAFALQQPQGLGLLFPSLRSTKR